MRWNALFDDLEDQFAAARAAEGEALVGELHRAEQSQVSLAERLAGQPSNILNVRTTFGQDFAGQLSHVGSEWLVLEAGGQSVLVPYASVQTIEGLGRHPGPALPRVQARLGLGSVFRALARDRALVTLHAGHQGWGYTGTIDRVGRDFLELAVVPAGDQRRAGNVVSVLALPFRAVSAVLSAN